MQVPRSYLESICGGEPYRIVQVRTLRSSERVERYDAALGRKFLAQGKPWRSSPLLSDAAAPLRRPGR